MWVQEGPKPESTFGCAGSEPAQGNRPKPPPDPAKVGEKGARTANFSGSTPEYTTVFNTRYYAIASGPEIGLPGGISAGFRSGKVRNRPSALDTFFVHPHWLTTHIGPNRDPKL